MSLQVTIKPEVLRWARERVSLAPAELARGMGWKSTTHIDRGEATGELSLSHLERLAVRTHTPVGYFFLPEPPVDRLPVADFRTTDAAPQLRPSPDLLETLYTCQQRQEWFRDYLLSQDADQLPFVARSRVTDSVSEVAKEIRGVIQFDIPARAQMATWEAALASMMEGTEQAGILVMRNGVVGNNSHRKLKVDEFRGFALSDPYAPLVFINASDAKSAQMFTLAHELAHIWLGASGVSNWRLNADRAVERFCNAVAAEVLVPREMFEEDWQVEAEPLAEASRLARGYKTSSLVILIQAREFGRITQEQFDMSYNAELAAIRENKGASGGDFYRTQGSRLGKRFARAVVASAMEGHLPYTEAFELLGVRKSETFNKLARTLEVTS